MEKLLSENSIAENMSLLSTSRGKYEVTDLGKKTTTGVGSSSQIEHILWTKNVGSWLPIFSY